MPFSRLDRRGTSTTTVVKKNPAGKDQRSQATSDADNGKTSPGSTFCAANRTRPEASEPSAQPEATLRLISGAILGSSAPPVDHRAFFSLAFARSAANQV